MTLRLTTRETRDGGGAVPGTQVTRHVIVSRAGAHFEFPCSDAKCEGGGYDLTSEVISELRRLTTRFTADCTCNGLVGDRPCGQNLEVIAQAAFK